MAAIDIDRREFSRDIPFFVAGALTTGAVTDIGKRVFSRPRPYCQPGGVLPPDCRADDSSLRFHAAGAFDVFQAVTPDDSPVAPSP